MKKIHIAGASDDPIRGAHPLVEGGAAIKVASPMVPSCITKPLLAK